ncbi:hypothetical protein [Jonesia quinghaiensis]|uniref:hypothetical protein n=1 Tax=Jonesia quinghaiensis TaxID=262806 RepID=UPI000411CC39|nr:hypothetical protein [Jonesia quinghaiensis]
MTHEDVPRREEELLGSLPALFFFLSLSFMPREHLDGSAVQPESILQGNDKEILFRLEQAVHETGLAALRGSMEHVIAHVGSVASDLSWGWLAPLNRPEYTLFQYREVFRPLARHIATDPAYDWWWEGGGGQWVTAKDTGSSDWSKLNDRQHWSNQPRYAHSIQTTPGPIGSAASTLAVCVDNDTMPQGDHRVMQFQGPMSDNGVRIRGVDDWKHLLSLGSARITSTQTRKDWDAFLGRHPRWVTPAWENIVEHVSWVELTLAGFLTTAYRPITVDGETTAIIGWNPGATMHFNVDPTPYTSWADTDHN